MQLPHGCKLYSTQDFAFVTSKGKMVTIRTFSLESGDLDTSFIAHPVGPFGSTPNKKFRTTGTTKDEALSACISLLSDIEDIEVIFSKENQQ